VGHPEGLRIRNGGEEKKGISLSVLHKNDLHNLKTLLGERIAFFLRQGKYSSFRRRGVFK